jgi:hypothetical protein
MGEMFSEHHILSTAVDGIRANTFVQSFYPTHKSSQYRATFPLGPRAQRGVNENMTVLSDSAVKDLLAY